MEIADIVKALPHGVTAIIAIMLYKLVERILLPMIKKSKEEEEKRQSNDWQETKQMIKELTKSVSELFSTAKLHEHRIGESESDIRELRSQISGLPHVKH
ncbi:MAG: hypothetical protein ABUT20_37135 [Bacteroidota bacterium]